MVQVVDAIEVAELKRGLQEEEFMVVLCTPESSATFFTEFGNEQVSGRAVVIVPPGESSIFVDPKSKVVQLFGRSSRDLMDEAWNSSWNQKVDLRVSPNRAWPEPIDGFRLRTYLVDDFPKDPKRLGRIFQSSIGMVNFFHSEEGPRDDNLLTPHSHPDFEQCTVHLAGDYVHHVRTPWTARIADWRPDEHRYVSSPGVIVIPAQSVHTSQAIHGGAHQLIDFFSPPRMDWARTPGWVLNGNEYPLPDSLDPERR